MKRIFVFILFVCGFFISLSANAIEEKKSVAVLPLTTAINTSSLALYSNTQDMFSADLVNSLQKYNDIDVLDIYTSEKILKISNVKQQYEKLTKQYKQRYVIDYDLANEVAQVLGVSYIVFVNGGFDMEKDFLKSNWKYRCQWIWANPVKSSALLTLNVTLIDIENRTIVYQGNVKKDFPMEDFMQPAQNFGENVVPISTIKKFTLPNAIKVAQQIHSEIYPLLNEKYSQKDAFIDKIIPNNGVIDSYENEGFFNKSEKIQQKIPQQIQQEDMQANPRKEMYKNWVQEKL